MMGVINRITRKITRERLNPLIKEYSTNIRTLDVGCANATYLNYFPNHIGLNIVRAKGVDIIRNVYYLPFKDAVFDTVLCISVREHLKEPKQALSEIKRVLKRGGRLILAVPFIFPLHDVPHDYHRFTKYGLQHLLNEWNIIELGGDVDTIPTISVLLQRIGYQADFIFKPLKLVFYVVARFLQHLNFIIKRQYGGGRVEDSIMTPNYFVVVIKT